MSYYCISNLLITFVALLGCTSYTDKFADNVIAFFSFSNSCFLILLIVIACKFAHALDCVSFCTLVLAILYWINLYFSKYYTRIVNTVVKSSWLYIDFHQDLFYVSTHYHFCAQKSFILPFCHRDV